MRKEYIRPDFSGETFTPNLRIAACSYDIVSNWSDVTFRCETMGSDISCSDGSQHNSALATIRKALTNEYNPFAKEACTTIISSVENLTGLIERYIEEHAGNTELGHWGIQTINGIPYVIARNPSGQHVLDIGGIDFYEDAFTS